MHGVDTRKYIALAYGSPAGIELAKLVDERWNDWISIVERAPWRNNWSEIRDSGKVARSIYVSAVWGFGILGWLRSERLTPHGEMMAPLLKAQERERVPDMLYNPTYYHPNLRQSKVPWEYGDLDIWLETLWIPAAT